MESPFDEPPSGFNDADGCDITEPCNTRRRSPVASFPRPWHDVSLQRVEVADVHHRQAEEIEGAIQP